MNYSNILISSENKIFTVTLNRPERKNAINDKILYELNEAFSIISRDNETRIVIINGSGDNFCSGMDIEYLHQCINKPHEENLEDARNFVKLLQSIQMLKKPVIAMVKGAALGGGLGIASACDYIFASRQTAKFGAPEVRIGFVPAIILSYLIKKIGESRAKEILLRGGIIDSETALQYGLVTECVDEQFLHERVNEFAKNIIESTSNSAVAVTKGLFSKIYEMNHKEILEFAANLNAITRKTEDFKRGIEAFLKKEKIKW